jgi:molybdate transport system substrate-binding protein
VTRTSRLLLVPITLLGLVAAACGGEDDDDSGSPTPTAAAAATTAAPTSATSAEGEIAVFAATSLTESFTDVGEAFTAQNPDAKATFSFDASSALVKQINEGAPADVFASADTANMDKLVTTGKNGGEPITFATNLLTIIVAPGNPKGITGVADLANNDLTTVICAPEVPCGAYANQIFEHAGVTVTPDSLEQNVRGVSTKVIEGEADAGIVYVTDVIAAGDDADTVEIPGDINVEAQYPIATVKDSGNAETGQAFIDFLLSEDGQAIMAKYGFGAP